MKSVLYQKRSGDPNPQYFSKSTAVQMGGVLPYKWEAYCSTNGRRTAGFPFLRSLEARKVLPYKWGPYCRTNWRCTAVLSPRPVGVGVSETLPIVVPLIVSLIVTVVCVDHMSSRMLVALACRTKPGILAAPFCHRFHLAIANVEREREVDGARRTVGTTDHKE